MTSFPNRITKIAASAAVAMAMLIPLAACSDDDSNPSVQADDTATTSQSDTTSSDEGPTASNAAVPTDCSDLSTEAVSEVLGGDAVLDPRSGFNATLEQLLCVWNTNDEVTEEVTVQVGAEADFIGFVASQEGTGTREHSEVDGFDEGRLYGDGHLIAKRNGLAVFVNASTVVPEATEEQLVAVAHEATT